MADLREHISFFNNFMGGSVAEWFRALDLKSGGP